MSNFLQDHLNKLKNKFDNPELELKILLNQTSIIKKEIVFSNFKIDDVNILKFKDAFHRRIKNEPIAKIFNSKSFWKYDFFVDTNVLDPRPETELIIEKVLEYFPSKNQHLKILDMCTGSGCLAISLAKEYPKAEIVATDISNKALKIAKENAKNLNCSNMIKFVNCDLLNKKRKYDIVVSNPPYLSKSEYESSSKEILLYEPKIALIASDAGYEYYFKISNILSDILSEDSKAFLEIGFSQAKKTIDIFKSRQINCLKVVKDIGNLNRVIILNLS